MGSMCVYIMRVCLCVCVCVWARQYCVPIYYYYIMRYACVCGLCGCARSNIMCVCACVSYIIRAYVCQYIYYIMYVYVFTYLILCVFDVYVYIDGCAWLMAVYVCV